MTKQVIPLFNASPNKEYMIVSIDTNKNKPTDFSGYGLMPGVKIKLLFSSPSKDPSAYEVMGAVLAIRQKDSNMIYVSEYSASSFI